MLRKLFRTLRPAETSARPLPVTRLRSAETIVTQWRASQRSEEATRSLTQEQLAGLLERLEDERFWSRLQALVRRTGAPWNAEDWPEGFDPMMLVIAQCQRVDYTCARCVLGRSQDGRSCANPSTLIGQLLGRIGRGDRKGVRAVLTELQERI